MVWKVFEFSQPVVLASLFIHASQSSHLYFMRFRVTRTFLVSQSANISQPHLHLVRIRLHSLLNVHGCRLVHGERLSVLRWLQQSQLHLHPANILNALLYRAMLPKFALALFLTDIISFSSHFFAHTNLVSQIDSIDELLVGLLESNSDGRRVEHLYVHFLRRLRGR